MTIDEIRQAIQERDPDYSLYSERFVPIDAFDTALKVIEKLIEQRDRWFADRDPHVWASGFRRTMNNEITELIAKEKV